MQAVVGARAPMMQAVVGARAPMMHPMTHPRDRQGSGAFAAVPCRTGSASQAWALSHGIMPGSSRVTNVRASQSRIMNQSGPTSGFEMYFAIGTQQLWCWGSQPKHVSNSVLKKTKQFNLYFILMILVCSGRCGGCGGCGGWVLGDRRLLDRGRGGSQLQLGLQGRAQVV